MSLVHKQKYSKKIEIFLLKIQKNIRNFFCLMYLGLNIKINTSEKIERS